MADIERFTHRPGWRLRNGKPAEIYPDGHALIITRSPGSDLKVDLTWIDSGPHLDQLLGVPFKEGRIDGRTADGRFQVTVTLEADGRLQGRVEEDFQPEAGTWGADANGG